MASGLDELNKAVKKHRGDILLTIAALATAENKWKALGRAVKDVAVYKMIGPLGIVLGTFKGIEGAVRGILRDTGALNAVLGRMSQIKGLERQFTGLLGSVTAARKRVAELMQFTNGQKVFNLDSSGRAARELEILTQGAFAGKEALQTLGDSAVQSGNQIEAVASGVGQFHRELRDGQPIRTTATALADMGVISQSAAQRLASLQENGSGTEAVFGALVGELQKAKGAMDEHSKSIDGVTAGYKKAREELAMKFGEPFKEAEINRMKDATTVLTALQGPISELGNFLNKIVSPLENVSTKVGAWLAKLNVLSPVVSGAVTVIKTLATGLLALGIAFGTRALGSFLIEVVKVAGASGKGAAALSAMRTAVMSATTATRQLAAGNSSLALTTAASGAASLRTAAAMGVAAIATKGLSLAVRALLAGTGIGLLVMLVGFVGEKLLNWSNAADEAAQRQRELADANREVESSMARQIASIQNLDDAQSALAKSTENLIAARQKLNDLEDKRSRNKKSVSPEEMREARRTYAAALNTNNSLGDKIRGGKFGLSRQQDEVLREGARRDLALDDATRSESINRATGANKIALMEQERQRLESDADEGRLMKAERAALEAGERTRAAGRGAKDAGPINALMRRKSPSSIIREEQTIADMRASGADPRTLQPRERALALRRERLEENQAQNDQRAREMQFAIERERKSQGLHDAEIRAEKQIATLRDRGFDREEQIAKSRIDSLLDQQGVLRGAGDEQGASDMEPRIQAAERELRLMQEKATLSRAMDASRLRVLEMERQSVLAAARGNFAEADEMRRAADAERDAMEMRKSVEDKLASGEFTKEDAEKAAQAEQADRLADRESRRNVFRAERERELRASELAVSSEDGAAEELTKLRDEDRFRSSLNEGLSAGLPAAEAAKLAMRDAELAIQRDAADAQRGGVVDSLTRIGGGGGVGSDPILTVQQRQQALQERMVTLLTTIATKAPDAQGPSGEADIPFE